MLRLNRSGKTISDPVAIVLDTSAPVAIDAREEQSVAQFLDDVILRLAPLTEDTRVGIRQELRVHLEALIAAHEELGDDHEAATVAAMRQFGEPRMIAHRFRRAWCATTKDTPWEAMRESLRVATIVMVVYIGVALLMMGLVEIQYSAVTDALTTAWCLGGILLLPILLGARVGWKFPKRSCLGWFYALTILIAVAGTSYLGIAANTTPTEFSISWPVVRALSCLEGALGLWLPIGCLSAAVAGTLKQRQTNRRLDCLPFAKG